MKRRVLLAFDSFKGSMTSVAACEAAAAGIRRTGATPVVCPMSDGGEGFVDAVLAATGVAAERFACTGPLMAPVEASIAWLEHRTIAVLEAAQTCGLDLVPAALRSPMGTTTVGLGEALLQAVEGGAKRIVVGLGGSATNDAGMGLLSALGWRFLDGRGRLLEPIGASMGSIARVKPGRRLAGVQIVAACDVSNPLFGPDGAASVYGPQKGAFPDEVAALDAGLRRFAEVTGPWAPSASSAPGAGAAGGLGYALTALLGAQYRSGAELMAELVDLDHKLAGCSLCLTGEGRTDAQTAFGKLPAVVARHCAEAAVACVCLSGSLGDGWESMLAFGCREVRALSDSPIMAMAEAPRLLADQAEAVARLYSG